MQLLKCKSMIVHAYHPRSLHFASPHFTSLHFSLLLFTSLLLTSLHCTTLHYTTLHFTSLHFTSLHFTSRHFTTLPFTTFHSQFSRPFTFGRFVTTCYFYPPFLIFLYCFSSLELDHPESFLN